MKKIALFAFAGIVLLLAGCAPAAQSSETFAMDTVISQTVYARDNSILIQNYDTIRALEDSMSKTLEGSDVFRLNHAGGQDVVFSSAQTAQALTGCLELARQTGGAFNPALGGVVDAWGFGTENASVPEQSQLERLLAEAEYTQVRIDGDAVNAGKAQIDLGGAAKGYALDALKITMDEAGVENALVAVGGSVYARGGKPDGSWKVGVRDPLGSTADFLAILELADSCVSTSGSYERGFTEGGVYYHHIIDPQTGYPVQNGLISVSVVDESGLKTDVYSTALFVMGLEQGLEFANSNSIDALFITEDKKIYMTDGFQYEFELINKDYQIEG
ncbi:FAD:protein FMN transferase [Christensenellaceae bacterium OttesenSCG-928-K19]|nr:FAD:protein FMN transferase [Christensenellaceae bacterium OttesenSCG-928-K19]